MSRYVFAALLLLIAGYCLTGVAQIRPGERAVVRRFGQVVARPKPGLWIGLPYGLDRIDRVPADWTRHVRIGFQPGREELDEISPPGQLLSGDHNLLNAQVVLDYTVSNDDERLEDFVLQAERIDGILARAADAVLAEWVAGRTVDEVLLRGKTELPTVLAERVAERIVPYRLGIDIQAASVSYLFPPDEVKPAFDEVATAQAEIQTREYVARQEAARRLREVDAEVERIQKLTAAYAKEQFVSARAEADSFERRRQQYQKLRQDNPDFLAGIWWEEIGKLFKQMKENGRIDLLDNHLGTDGLDITEFAPLPKKK